MPTNDEKKRFWENYSALITSIEKIGWKVELMWKVFCAAIGLLLLSAGGAILALVMKGA